MKGETSTPIALQEELGKLLGRSVSIDQLIYYHNYAKDNPERLCRFIQARVTRLSPLRALTASTKEWIRLIVEALQHLIMDRIKPKEKPNMSARSQEGVRGTPGSGNDEPVKYWNVVSEEKLAESKSLKKVSNLPEHLYDMVKQAMEDETIKITLVFPGQFVHKQLLETGLQEAKAFAKKKGKKLEIIVGSPMGKDNPTYTVRDLIRKHNDISQKDEQVEDIVYSEIPAQGDFNRETPSTIYTRRNDLVASMVDGAIIFVAPGSARELNMFKRLQDHKKKASFIDVPYVPPYQRDMIKKL